MPEQNNKGSLERKLRELLQSREEFNSSAFSLAEKGLKSFESGNLEEGIQLLTKALDKNQLETYLKVAMHLISQKRNEEAEAVLNRVIELHPNNFLGYALLGAFYNRQEKFREAEDALNKAMDLNLKDNNYVITDFGEKIAVELGRCREMKDLKAEEESLKKEIEKSPNTHLYYRLGKCYWDQSVNSQSMSIDKRKREKMWSSYKDAISVLTDEIDVAENIIHYSLEFHNFELAEDASKKVLEINPEHGLSHFALGRCYLEKKNYEKAEKEFRKTIELNFSREGYDPYFKLGECCAEQGKIEEAKKVYQKALENVGNVFRDYSNMEFRKKLIRLALEDLEDR